MRGQDVDNLVSAYIRDLPSHFKLLYRNTKMKRLNPNTNAPFKQGDLREDGYVFRNYKYPRPLTKNGYFQESWVSQESNEKIKQQIKSSYKISRSTKEGHIRKTIQWIKCKATKDKVPFDLTFDYVSKIAPDICPVFNKPLLWSNQGKIKQFSPSLDRIIPNKGYIDGNVQWLSYLANAMKQNATPDEIKLFAEWALTSQIPDA